MLSVLVSGLSSSAMSILSEAMEKVYGGTVSIEELDSSRLRSRVRLSNRSVGVVLVVLDGKSSEACRDIEDGLYSSSKYIEYSDDYSFTKELNSRFGLSLSLPSTSTPTSSRGYSSEVVGLRAINADLEMRLGSALEELEKYKGTISELENKLESLEIDKANLSSELSRLNANNYEETISNLEKENIELQDRVKEDSGYISRLNLEVSSLKTQLSTEVEKYEKEIADLKSNKARSLRDLNILYNSKIRSLISSDVKYSNIEFVFSGSSESRRGTYKSILEKIENSGNSEEYLFVDLVSEVFSDYIFAISKPVSGIEWFSSGGNLDGYLSRSGVCSVLISNIGFVNDLHFLCIDWESRLRELDNSGYKVIIYCGDISNFVGRVLHESFAGCGMSSIYVLGNVVSSRSVIANLRGISNSSYSTVYYFDYNSAISRFYDIARKTNDCKILSTKGSGRR